MLRDQRTVAGIGRGHTDDALWRARLSPYATLASLGPEERQRLLDEVRATLSEAIERERERTGGLSEPKLGDKFVVHAHVASAIAPHKTNSILGIARSGSDPSNRSLQQVAAICYIL